MFTTFGLILKSSVLYKNASSGGIGSSGISNGMSSQFIYLPLPAAMNEDDEADESTENETAILSLNGDDNHSNKGNVVSGAMANPLVTCMSCSRYQVKAWAIPVLAWNFSLCGMLPCNKWTCRAGKFDVVGAWPMGAGTWTAIRHAKPKANPR